MRRMNICFRVEAGNRVGMGHLYESISLAASFKKRIKGEIIFFINDCAPASEIIKNSGFTFRVIEEQTKDRDVRDVKKVLSLMKEHKSKVLVVGLLEKDNNYYKRLKYDIEKLIVVLDDTQEREVSADILVNFNIAQDENFYSSLSESETIYCIGPKYTLQTENMHAFWKKEKIISNACKAIFVNQGGSDPFGLTIEIIKALELLKLKQKVIVVIGPAVLPEHKKEIADIKVQLRNSYQFEYSVSQQRMYQLMAQSDMAITAAGNTLYELAIFGVPSIVICHHEEHNKVAKKFEERKAVINMGLGLGLENDVIAEQVKELFNSKEERILLSANIKKITDGLGSKRVSETILNTCQKYS